MSTPMMLAQEQTNDCSCGHYASFVHHGYRMTNDGKIQYSVCCLDCGKKTGKYHDPFRAKDEWNKMNLVQMRLL